MTPADIKQAQAIIAEIKETRGVVERADAFIALAPRATVGSVSGTVETFIGGNRFLFRLGPSAAPEIIRDIRRRALDRIADLKREAQRLGVTEIDDA